MVVVLLCGGLLRNTAQSQSRGEDQAIRRQCEQTAPILKRCLVSGPELSRGNSGGEMTF